jgi:alkylated DNA repair dioxygenase AlkB
MPYEQINQTTFGDGKIKYYPNFIKSQENTYQSIVDSIPWDQGVYNMYGKEVFTPRLLWAMRDEDSDISKEYNVTGSSVWNEMMAQLRTEVEEFLRTEYFSKKENEIKNLDISKSFLRYAQLNYYRDGKDYIGWHTDKEMKENDIIVSISLGTARRFQFMNIKDNNIKYELSLEPGSLLIFDTIVGKKEWKHRIPKELKVKDGRINITFRT